MEVLAARAAIADLVYTYALNIRAGNGADCVRLFTQDGVFEVREASLGNRDAARTRSRLTGHDAISSYLVRAAGSEHRVCPMIHNLLIQVNGGEATSNCVMTSLVWPSGQQLLGEYHDTYRFETGWRFSSRVFTILSELSKQAAGA
jgi:hypothetical protein